MRSIRYPEMLRYCPEASLRLSSLAYPATMRLDNAIEFISLDLDLCAYYKGVVLDFSRLGKPTDHSYLQSFNGKYRT